MYIPRSNIIEIGYVNTGKFYKTKFKSPLSIPPSNQFFPYQPADKIPFEGYYHKDKSNTYWSGKEHNDDSVILIEIINDNTIDSPDVGIYPTLNPTIYSSEVITPDFILPTSDDYTRGYFSRYVVKPVISSQINDFFEVKPTKYQQITQNSSLLTLYKTVIVTWVLIGPLYDIYDNNIRIASGRIDSNKRSIDEAEKTLPNVSLYFTDLRQFGRSQ